MFLDKIYQGVKGKPFLCFIAFLLTRFSKIHLRGLGGGSYVIPLLPLPSLHF
jgi:hypothetical protein